MDNDPLPRPSLDGAVPGRVIWSSGRAVRLADGLWWSLPRIDAALLVSDPALVDEFIKTFEVTEVLALKEPDREQITGRSALYHAQLAQLAVALLLRNYDLPIERWRRLLTFGDIADLPKLTRVVADAVAESTPAWMPFLPVAVTDRYYASPCN